MENTKNAVNYGIDWKNVDLNDGYNRDQKILDPYSFNMLLLEIHCNIKKEEISEETIKKQFEEQLQNKVRTAREILNDNLKNIMNYALKTK